jgi:hypothetical protein
MESKLRAPEISTIWSDDACRMNPYAEGAANGQGILPISRPCLFRKISFTMALSVGQLRI